MKNKPLRGYVVRYPPQFKKKGSRMLSKYISINKNFENGKHV